jgi:phospholipase/carboxylesterase
MGGPAAGRAVTNWPHVFRPGTGVAVLALHGTGGSESEIAALAASIAPGAAILAPRGRVSENGAGRWFRRASEGVFDVDDVIHRADELAGFLTEAIADYHLGALPLVAMGFSNGANMALALATLHPELAPSVVAFSGMYPFGTRTMPRDLGKSRFLLLNGTDDPMAPQVSVDTLAASAVASGADVTRVSRKGGHGISDDELAQAAEWIGTPASGAAQTR